MTDISKDATTYAQALAHELGITEPFKKERIRVFLEELIRMERERKSGR